MGFVAHEKKGKTKRKKEERKRSFSTSCHCFHYMITTSTLLRQYCIALEEISINKMGTKKMKGIYKGFNKYISQMFVVKEEHEMQIGNPTDVKHVAHIGWDGQSSNAPSWMNEFKTTSDFSSTSLNNMCDSTWSSQEFEKSLRREQDLDPQNLKSSSLASTTEEPQSVPKKQKRKKTKSSLSEKNLSSSSSSKSTSTLQSKTSSAASSREHERRRGIATRANKLGYCN
ncbi:hypothetical protein MKW92_032057 [Papaver armeniacum]|nr:hypothetical protein MKW92_032057 [Papaver armeniacum]